MAAMRWTQIFCRMDCNIMKRKMMAVCVGIFLLAMISGKQALGESVSSSLDHPQDPKTNTEQVINIIDPVNGQIIRQMKTQEEIDDWQMERECQEKQSSVMFVGLPKDKAGVWEHKLKRDAARRIAECIAEGYYRKGKLDQAITYYGDVIAMSRTALDACFAHEALAKIYEEKRQYPLAIQQLDWLISRSNEETKKELMIKKNNLLARAAPPPTV